MKWCGDVGGKEVSWQFKGILIRLLVSYGENMEISFGAVVMSDEFVTIEVYPVGSEGFAHIAKMRLESDGIKAFILGENLLPAQPFSPSKVIELKVSLQNAERAKKILDSEQ